MARRIPRLEVIEAFLEAARAPNFRTAAERCALSSTAFTRRIQAFTTFVGRPVFERHAGGMRLTAIGQEYLAALEPAYREMRRAVLDVGAGQPARKVTVSLSHSLAVGWLIPRLSRFRACHSDIEVVIQTRRTAELIRNGDVDLGLCATDVDVSGLHVESLIDVWVTPVACPRIAAEIEGGAQLLEDYPLLGITQNPNLWSWWSSEAGLRSRPLQESTRFDMAHALYESAAGGFGIAIGLMALIGPHLQSGRLVDLGLPLVRFPGGYRLVGRSKRLRDGVVAAFRNWLVEEASESNTQMFQPTLGSGPTPSSRSDHDSDMSKRWPVRQRGSVSTTLET